MRQGFFVGRVGNDAEITYTLQGIAVTKFSLAIDNGKDKEGEKRAATWIKCAIWRDRAEKLGPYIKKGIVVAVSGDVDARAWSDKNSGEARCQMEVNVNQFTFGGSKSDSSEAEAPAVKPAGAGSNASASIITDEDIPF
jgi:single-strand DNA-binding protein